MNTKTAQLTPHQLEVVWRTANSETRKEIAASLGVTIKYVDWHATKAAQAIRLVLDIPGSSKDALMTRYAMATDITGHRYHQAAIRNQKVQEAIRSVQANLTPDLLQGRWKEQTHPLEGHCYVAAEALWHLLGPRDWMPVCASYTDAGGRATHWWLRHRRSGHRADPTAEQYAPDSPPYHLGRPCGFLTARPSRRAQIVLDRILNLQGNISPASKHTTGSMCGRTHDHNR